MRLSRSFWVSTPCLLLLACGPAEAPPPTTAVKPAPTTPKPPPAIPEDRTPVDAPQGLVLSVHAAPPKALVHALKSYVPAAKVPLDPRALVRELPDGDALEKIVDVDKPADLALVLPESQDPEAAPDVAVAFGVEDGLDLDVALKGALHAEVVAGGVRKLVRPGSKHARCVVAPAIGPAKYRLVCAFDRDPMRLAPWLSRGVTRAPETNVALKVDVDVASVKKRYAGPLDKARSEIKALVVPEVKVGQPNIDKVLKKIAATLAEEAFDVIDDLDALSFEATTPPEGVSTKTAVAFSGSKSWLARALLAGDGVTGGAPAAFAKLPADSVWLATFVRQNAQTDALAQPIQMAARDLVEAAAADFKWPAKDKDLALDVVKWMFPQAADYAAVHGALGHVDAPKDAEHGRGKGLMRALMRKAFTVAVVEREAKSSIALARAFAAWVVRPSVTATIKELTRDRLVVKITAKETAQKGLPKGSLAQTYGFDVSVNEEPMPPVVEVAGGKPGKPKPKPQPKGKPTPLAKLTASTLVVPDGARTWSGWAQNLPPEDLWAKVSAGMSGSGGATLSTKPGFAFVTQGNASSGGLMLVDGLLGTVDRKGKLEEMTSHLPDQGHGAFAWRTSATKSPKSSAEATVLVPRDAIAAMAWFVTR